MTVAMATIVFDRTPPGPLSVTGKASNPASIPPLTKGPTKSPWFWMLSASCSAQSTSPGSA
jgi:hypothetical protein